jgi:hypothetical protein
MGLRRISLFFLLATLLTACDRSPKERNVEPERLERAFLTDFTPVLEGGGYAASFGDVWYVTGTNAVRVRGLPEHAAIGLNIVPSVSGGAYAITMNKGVWFLDRDIATPVKEVSALSDISERNSADQRSRVLFVLWQAETSRRKSAEANLTHERDVIDDDNNRELPR